MDKVRQAWAWATPGKPISRKVLAQLIASVGMYLVTLAVTKAGIHLDAATSNAIAAGVAAAAGYVAGWLKREVPGLVEDDAPTSTIG